MKGRQYRLTVLGALIAATLKIIQQKGINMTKEQKKHKHCDLIKAWADGAEIQMLAGNEWIDVYPDWTHSTYRIKPRPHAVEVQVDYRGKLPYMVRVAYSDNSYRSFPL